MTSDQSLDGSTILIVEDEYLIADDLARELEDAGAAIAGPVATIDRAEELVQRHAPDLAVLDINLRGDDVFPLAAALAAQDIPFVFVTGYDAAVIPDKFAHVPRCEKPARPSAIAAALRDARAQANRPKARISSSVKA